MQAYARISPSSQDWPSSLENVEDPPSRLWLRGDRRLLAPAPRVAIVGTRAPTPYGEAQAARFSRALVAAGACVVSGLARGIDSAAHSAALNAGGGTIAILGCGVDAPWPAGRLAERMATEGLLLSEFPPGTRPRRHHFPLRNRLIAGLCSAVLVVEAAERSGSLVTARWALSLGVDVLAIPGRVDHPMARGTLSLLRDGATPVGSPEQLLRDVFGVDAEGPLGTDARPGPSDPVEANVYAALEGESLTAAEVAARIRADLGEVIAALVGLELAGWVRLSPGGIYSRHPA